MKPSFIRSYLLNLGALVCGREPARPLMVSWYITHRCALACRYCCDGSGRPFKTELVPELEGADVERLLAIIRAATDTLVITGGEPLVRQDLEVVLAYARERLGFRIVLNTKGIGLRQRPDVLKHIDMLVLSVDALEPARLAAVTGMGEPAAVQVLDALLFLTGQQPGGRPMIVLSSVAMPENLEDVGEVLAFASKHGMRFHMSPELQGTDANPALRGSQAYRELVESARTLKRKGARVLGIDGYLRGIRDFSRFRCHPLLMPAVRPNGTMLYPCLERPTAKIDLMSTGSMAAALRQALKDAGALPQCGDECHIFCHMALSLAQRHPLAAIAEPV